MTPNIRCYPKNGWIGDPESCLCESPQTLNTLRQQHPVVRVGLSQSDT